METHDRRVRLSGHELILILLVFCICLTGALTLPVDQCPDEVGRRFLSDWIYRTGTLPTGDELATMLMSWEDASAPTLSIIPGDATDGWGFSYALRPYLTSIVAALCMKAAALFTDSSRVLLAASRMCSVLSVTFCCVYSLRLGHRLFNRRSSAILLGSMVCFLPQVMFLGMYQNNDSLSLCTVSMMLYYWVEGYDSRWSSRSCVGLAAAFSLAFLSYYSVYGWIITSALFCVLAVLTEPELSGKGRLILRRGALIAGICLVLAGWFFVRNAILHDGDFLGIASEQVSREKMRALGYKLTEYTRYRDQGLSPVQFLMMHKRWWLIMTAKSFVGCFGYMDIQLPNYQYVIYFAILLAGVVLYAAALVRQRPDRRDALLICMMLLAGGITFLLHFWQSYTRDYQSQGRYIITLALILAYMTAYGFDRMPPLVRKAGRGRAAALPPAYGFMLLWLLMFIWTALKTMTIMLP